MKSKTNYFSKYVFGLGVFIYIYLLLRAYFNEPLHDEVACFFNYIETGKILGQGIVQDAQNHLLHSYLTRFFFLLFGDHFFVLRIPSLLSFPLYFLGIYQLSLFLKENYQRVLLLTALTTIPFIVEYFAYSRGYALGISFFIWMIIYSIKWAEKQSLKYSFLVYFFSYLAVFSNLIYFGPAFLAMSLIGIYHLKNIRIFTLKENVLLFGLHICFIVSILPFIWFSYVLKNGGALYHGSLNGLWEVTGKSLTKNVLFYDANWQKMIWLTMLGCFALIILYLFKQNRFWNQFKEKENIIAYYFFGNIAIILLLAHFLKVNYPMDRAGMYLIPLFILLFVFIVIKKKQTAVLLYLLLFFPCTFMLKMNLHTSVFSQYHRMTDVFYQEVRSKISPDNSLILYPLSGLTWCRHERERTGSKINPKMDEYIDPAYDVVITRSQNYLESEQRSEFEVFAEDKASTLVALKKKRKIERIQLLEAKSNIAASRKKQIVLFETSNCKKQIDKNILIQIKGTLEIHCSFDKIGFIIQTSPQKKIETCNQRWLEGSEKQKIEININYVLSKNEVIDDKLFVYICNPDGRLITFKNGITKVFELKP